MALRIAGRVWTALGSLVLLAIAVQGAQVLVQRKLGQHLHFVQAPGALPQAPEPPTSRGIQAVQGLSNGDVVVLCSFPEGGAWLQLFSQELVPRHWVQVPQAVWVDLAVLPGPNLILATQDGLLRRYDGQLRLLEERHPGLRALGALKASPDGGRLLALDSDRNALVDLDPVSLEIRQDVWTPLLGQEMGKARMVRMALSAQGRIGVLLQQASALWLGVVDGGGFVWLRAIPQQASPCQYLAASGEAFLVNDCRGPQGVAAWRAEDGSFIGRGIRLGQKVLLESPAFIAADAGSGRVYFHHTHGLRLGRLP